MNKPISTSGESLEHGRSIVFRNGIVLTMDDARRVIKNCDVLVVGGEIKEIGPNIQAPADALSIDASGGIIMPGMIDTHRHMWQTAMRAYGADWTLSQYFVWYYLEHGKNFRPQDVYAGNLLSAIEAVDAGVTTSVDWSHGLQTIDHADAAVDALEEIDGRFVLAYGNIQRAPWEWTADKGFQDFFSRRFDGKDRLGFQIAFDVVAGPEFPERAAFDVARDLGVSVNTHAGVLGANGDDSIRLMHENGYMTPDTILVHCATLSDDSYQRIAACGSYVSVSTESEQSAGQGYPSSWKLRQFGIPITLSHDTSVWWSADLFTAMRTTLGADRSRQHFEAHLKGETVTQLDLRSDDVIDWATRGGAKALGLDSKIGSIEVGKRADIVLVKNDESPVMFPIVNPYGHIAMQAQRADVHTVVIDGNIVKHEHRLINVDLAKARRAVEETVGFLETTLGEEAWEAGMHPDLPPKHEIDNPYHYNK
ncbi:MAG: amidohydrolase family protein [Acidobacteriota bacterium]|nr:amidohydrolase family protein [Acidobacteriota bacterium]MDE3082608.1 amidohydrolase family protein [Acidobacteriota bacterium]